MISTFSKLTGGRQEARHRQRTDPDRADGQAGLDGRRARRLDVTPFTDKVENKATFLFPVMTS
jgi:hypothetical protein